MKKRLPTRLSTWLLTLVMLLSLVPAMGVTASAGEMLPPLEVGTYKELRSAILRGKSRIKLKNDINTRDVYASGVGIPENQMITIGYDEDITLDLNGCTLALETLVSGGISFFTVYGELEIKDSSPGQTGKITGKFPARLASMFHTRGGTLTLQSGTLMTYSDKNDVIKVGSSGGHVVINGGRICSGIWDTSSTSPCGYAVLAVTGFVDVEEMEVIINGGVFDGAVGFFPLSEFTCEKPRFHIYGGTFKKDVLLRCGQKTFKTHSPILEICGGSFEGGLKIYDWGMDLVGNAAQSYPPFKLLGGTFSCTMDLCYEKSSWGFYSPNLDQIIDALSYERMGPVFAAMFENSAIVKPGGTYIADDIGKGIDWAEREGYGGYYQMLLKGTADNPIRIIPDVAMWGMKSVTLDGKPIDYFKDWKGTVENLTNDTAHTLKFEWYPLTKELKDAGYNYRTECEHYISGSTAVQQTDTIAADKTSHTITIPAGVDPKVYSYDLQLNLEKNGSFVGIIVNQHIVKLMVNPAPVVDPRTPIDSVTLNVPKLPEGATSGGNFTLSGTNTGVSTINTVWENIPSSGVVAGKFYVARITLTAEDGYAFNTKTQVNLNGDYSSQSSGIENGGAGMIILVSVPVRHEHNFGPWQIAGTGNVHFRNCSCGVQESKPHEWKYLEGQDKYKCNVCGYEIDGEKDRITYVYASPRSPIAGEHPGDYTAAEWVKIGGANYKVESIVWKNMDDTDVTTFESGKIYKGTVTFKADTGFAFDGGRIYASKIFNSSNAEVVGDYTLTDKGSTLTATFKLKNEDVVKPGLQVKVKLPTLNGKIGQSLPAAELVDTTLPKKVKFMYNVYENDISKEVTDVPDYKVKPNQKYFYMVWLQPEDSTSDDFNTITNTYNVSYTVTGGGDAETYADFAGYGVLATYQTPDTSQINVSVRGKVVSYNPNNPTTVQLMQGGTEKYSTTIKAATGSSQVTQNFTLAGVLPGTYDLVVTKPGHLTYTVKGVVVEGTAIDLTKNSNKAISTITLLCGDIAKNGYIDFADYQELLSPANYGKKTTDTGVNALADLNGNGYIDFADYQILLSSQHYGKSTVTVDFAE